ncbi:MULTISPECIES: DUF4190 domain-containing protein [unclassified Lentimonas]|uniref:DUF4190 domain-containing protein n=1 Tax=unclassified Lentimonas TaxID=2630993 RepID=UPI001325E982|nr:MULTISPECIES: DUF4190 domain-containing protein [unclassified Lentimonas]CAA6676360.1 Unannotated [Lentimonas sp. CC4]CAA6685198.1 Unannotated [Lentimonas sp. CC6]CAA6693373.1 Unannotated [Lentimonas sp. CC19]CAA6696503.1 Unannotated [Lentimonas sp. CC10]CAA7072406.1 Unannotated [Lentimonas sp. CC11]
MQLPPPIKIQNASSVSGLAVTSLVFGIIGIVFGWLFILPPLVAIILGHIARASCRKHAHLSGSGIALSGLILGYIGILPVILMVASAVARIDEIKASAPRPAIVDAPEYMTLIGEDLSGSGFHFSTEDGHYIACSLHQFDGATPKVMHSGLLETTVEITKLVSSQDDLQVLQYTGDGLDTIPPLLFEYQPEITLGTPIYLYNFDEPYKGHISKHQRGTNNYSIQMEAPFPAGGNSGSPVVSAETGKVIGVMLSANSSEAATRVGFEALSWNPSPER